MLGWKALVPKSIGRDQWHKPMHKPMSAGNINPASQHLSTTPKRVVDLFQKVLVSNHSRAPSIKEGGRCTMSL
jgi:GTP cyclohydrolase I